MIFSGFDPQPKMLEIKSNTDTNKTSRIWIRFEFIPDLSTNDQEILDSIGWYDDDGTSSSVTGSPVQCCGKQPGSEELTIDHVLPRAQGGTSTWENCVLACIECNAKKADRTPDQARMPLRREPVRPVWKPLYGSHGMRIDSWSKFVSEAYWTVQLEE